MAEKPQFIRNLSTAIGDTLARYRQRRYRPVDAMKLEKRHRSIGIRRPHRRRPRTLWLGDEAVKAPTPKRSVLSRRAFDTVPRRGHGSLIISCTTRTSPRNLRPVSAAHTAAPPRGVRRPSGAYRRPQPNAAVGASRVASSLVPASSRFANPRASA